MKIDTRSRLTNVVELLEGPTSTSRDRWRRVLNAARAILETKPDQIAPAQLVELLERVQDLVALVSIEIVPGSGVLETMLPAPLAYSLGALQSLLWRDTCDGIARDLTEVGAASPASLASRAS